MCERCDRVCELKSLSEVIQRIATRSSRVSCCIRRVDLEVGRARQRGRRPRTRSATNHKSRIVVAQGTAAPRSQSRPRWYGEEMSVPPATTRGWKRDAKGPENTECSRGTKYLTRTISMPPRRGCDLRTILFRDLTSDVYQGGCTRLAPHSEQINCASVRG